MESMMNNVLTIKPDTDPTVGGLPCLDKPEGNSKLPMIASSSRPHDKKRFVKPIARHLAQSKSLIEVAKEKCKQNSRNKPVRRGNRKRFFKRGGLQQQEKMLRRRGPRRLSGSNNAPFNSTQFLMNDRGSESIRYLDAKLDVQGGASSAPENSIDEEVFARRQVSRARDSSFSLDSDEDYYYSSPEGEEEFVNQEFMKDYQLVRIDCLKDMTKSELINEFLQLEHRMDTLEKRVAKANESDHEEDRESPPAINPEQAKKIMELQAKVIKLQKENDLLRRRTSYLSADECGVEDEPNDDVQNMNEDSCSTCCSSSSSSSTSTSSSAGVSCSSGDEDQDIPLMNGNSSKDFGECEDLAMAVDGLAADDEPNNHEPREVQDDTGYESGQSVHVLARANAELQVNGANPEQPQIEDVE